MGCFWCIHLCNTEASPLQPQHPHSTAKLDLDLAIILRVDMMAPNQHMMLIHLNGHGRRVGPASKRILLSVTSHRLGRIGPRPVHVVNRPIKGSIPISSAVLDKPFLVCRKPCRVNPTRKHMMNIKLSGKWPTNCSESRPTQAVNLEFPPQF